MKLLIKNEIIDLSFYHRIRKLNKRDGETHYRFIVFDYKRAILRETDYWLEFDTKEERDDVFNQIIGWYKYRDTLEEIILIKI